MFINISRDVRVYITKEQRDFIKRWGSKPFFLQTELSPDQAMMAKILADKSVLVRKKILNNTQYALNKDAKLD